MQQKGTPSSRQKDERCFPPQRGSATELPRKRTGTHAGRRQNIMPEGTVSSSRTDGEERGRNQKYIEQKPIGSHHNLEEGRKKDSGGEGHNKKVKCILIQRGGLGDRKAKSAKNGEANAPVIFTRKLRKSALPLRKEKRKRQWKFMTEQTQKKYRGTMTKKIEERAEESN